MRPLLAIVRCVSGVAMTIPLFGFQCSSSSLLFIGSDDARPAVADDAGSGPPDDAGPGSDARSCTTTADCPLVSQIACIMVCSDGSDPCNKICRNNQCVNRGCP